MVGTNIFEEVGSGKLFDHIDELLGFENEDVGDGLFGCGAVDIDSFPPVWFEESSASFSGGCSDERSDLSVGDHTGRYDIVHLEQLSNFVQDSLSKVKSTPICHAKRARSKRSRPATFNSCATIQLIPPSYHPDKDPNKNPPRKCTHCQVTTSPLWRVGPNGPKTLCNACGIRYSSGRLRPEYRPFASPTFNHSLHSSSHWKLRLRTQQPEMKSKIKTLPSTGFDGETDNKDNNRSLYLSSRRQDIQMRNQQPEKKQKTEILPFSSGFGGETESKGNDQLLHLISQRKVIQMRNQQSKKKPKMKSLTFCTDYDEVTDNQDNGLKKNPSRNCTHCQMTETSQWRIGLNDSSTLCNPCGIRYGSGRLFPEYKPLASPTFVPSLHSNYHRKVTTRRVSKNKETELLPKSETVLRKV